MCAYPRDHNQVGRSTSLIAEVFRRYGAEYRQRHLLTSEQRLALTNISRCRTLELGGHEQRCPRCGLIQYHYNSCRDRNCPLCQWMDQAEWSHKQAEREMSVPVFLVTFTVPSELRRLAQQNPGPIYALMFHATSRTLRHFADREKLGRLGTTSILHTWSREMNLHPHIHSKVTAGGFDGERWNQTKPDFLFSIERVRAEFRKRMIRGLRRLHKKRKLKLRGELESLSEAEAFASFLKDLGAKDWIVDIQAPPAEGDPKHATKYLAMYTRSVAISDHRMLSVGDDGAVTFKTREEKTLTLDWEEFMRRFFLHVLPSGFRKVRHYGIYSNSSGKQLEAAKAALAAQRADSNSEPLPLSETPEPPATWQERVTLLTGVDPTVCPRCQHRGMIITRLEPSTPCTARVDQDASIPANDLFTTYASRDTSPNTS